MEFRGFCHEKNRRLAVSYLRFNPNVSEFFSANSPLFLLKG